MKEIFVNPPPERVAEVNNHVDKLLGKDTIAFFRGGPHTRYTVERVQIDNELSRTFIKSVDTRLFMDRDGRYAVQSRTAVINTNHREQGNPSPFILYNNSVADNSSTTLIDLKVPESSDVANAGPVLETVSGQISKAATDDFIEITDSFGAVSPEDRVDKWGRKSAERESYREIIKILNEETIRLFNYLPINEREKVEYFDGLRFDADNFQKIQINRRRKDDNKVYTFIVIEEDSYINDNWEKVIPKKEYVLDLSEDSIHLNTLYTKYPLTGEGYSEYGPKKPLYAALVPAEEAIILAFQLRDLQPHMIRDLPEPLE